MTKTKTDGGELSAQLNAMLSSKERENRQLYKLVNGLKERISALEIELSARDVTIEDLQASLAAQDAPKEGEEA